jgi:nitrous oxide reductase accessory protein NosL
MAPTAGGLVLAAALSLAAGAARAEAPKAPRADAPGGASSPADPPASISPGPREKCPVCGMFVARHPEWVAAVTFADGSRAVFDGAKDAFRFLLEPGRYLPGKRAEDVRAVAVTDYYAVRPVDARAAYFVLGSDVFGPMGRELVPFAAEADAREFLADHRGTRILRFAEVGPAVLEELE